MKTIHKLEKSQEYLELNNVDELIYPLQKLEYLDWKEIEECIQTWNETERNILTDAVLEINDNKKSNYDSSIIFGITFINSNNSNAEIMMTKLDFLDNGMHKKIDLLDKIYLKINNIEKENLNKNIDFESKYNLLHKLYADAY